MRLKLKRILLIAMGLVAPVISAQGAPERPIRHGVTSKAATGDLRAAWLAGETGRYRHFVLGDRFEAARLVVRDATGAIHAYALPENEVFEDREARIVDLGGDGRGMVAVVVSRADAGSLLALFALRNGRLQRIGETPPNGQPNRWLNPSGVGRFTGKEGVQIAIVRTPHLDGRLEIWAYGPDGLHKVASAAGYATHRLGSRHQRLFAVIPRRNGSDLLAVPTLDRRALAVLDFSRPSPEITRYPLDGRADGAFRLIDEGANGHSVVVPLENGEARRVTIRP